MHRINGPGHVNNMWVFEDPATNRPPTEFTADWFNAVQEELVALATADGSALDAGNHAQCLASLMGRLRKYPSGSSLPDTNTGPIWHDDYNSLMTWQSFTGNGALYTGYASVNIGELRFETQPTPRAGWVGSGAAALSRTTYAALRNWAIHNGVLVASAAWAAGTLLYKDNADGTTFTVADVRGEFPRFWDGGRGIDPARTHGSNQAGSAAAVDANGLSSPYILGLSVGAWGAPNYAAACAKLGLDQSSTARLPDLYVTYYTNPPSESANVGGFGVAEMRSRNVAGLPEIKY